VEGKVKQHSDSRCCPPLPFKFRRYSSGLLSIADPGLCPTIFRVRPKNRLNVDVYRGDDLEGLVDVARRLPLTKLDDPYVQSDGPKKRSSHKRADRSDEDPRRHQWHVAKRELLLKRIARNARLMQCSVSALRQLLKQMWTITRAKANMQELLRAQKR
jgi:hypothetical protein